MSRPKHRISAPGAYFVTTRTWEGRRLFHKEPFANVLVEILLSGRERGFYLLHDFIIMPNHLHLVLTPAANTSLEKAVQMIKGGSSYRIGRELQTHFPIWQKGFHEHWIRSQADYEQRRRYIELNPVRAGLVPTAKQYPYSSANGQFSLDPFRMTSAAKAARGAILETAGLKPRPAKTSGFITSLSREESEDG